uniref:Uncharacterized protein n=1 Tax=Haptolina brevifila TaxID=156173 RepID=A0A7S2NAA0_9EUKA|mmetsp:Transcript_71338/g.141443  ORF Transcript_71338/g.141443 Transcript_71338/m.141443 type:complete len:186 (+) Transcript_71338:39-596(+)|eukprot:CAMPEP_0174715704 /NCGR_PEP_ID=MMETSP1094-20130205/22017_1 /TAXON_ID=156173 /ORGANISM="Chrysochromulina brevifilum, Strain UTEX LB 985" /LENGTH=185 /DNA_ID=CAMNT_0015915325 /DNA_START=29 /DNA_END=586 /DNA_ORIENTATION=-
MNFLVVATLSFSPPGLVPRSLVTPPKLPSIAVPCQVTAPATAFLVVGPLATAPALAVDGSFDPVGAILNLVLTVAVLGLLGFIGKYALEAASTIGEESAKVAAKISELDGAEPKQQQSKDDAPLYDNAFEQDLATLRAPVGAKKKRLNTDEDLAKFAPWMARNINQDMIEKNKEERKKRLKREGK